MPKRRLIEACDHEIELAGNLIESEQYTEAVRALKNIYDENEELIDESPYLRMGLHSYLGLSFYHLDETGDRKTNDFLLSAVKHFNHALEVKEASENILFMRAKCHDYLDNFELAKKDYESVIELNPEAKCVQCFLGLLMDQKGYWDRAIELYQEALRQDPTDQVAKERLEILLEK